MLWTQQEKERVGHIERAENPMDGGAWCATVHGVAKSGTQLSGFTYTVKNRKSLIKSTSSLKSPLAAL